MIEVKFTCANAHEFKNLLALLTSGNEEAASAYEDAETPAKTAKMIKTGRNPVHTVTDGTGTQKQPTTEEIAAVEPAQDEPAQEPEQPTVTVQELQTLGRKLAAAGKGAEVQAVLKKHGVKLISKIPEAERAAAYAELWEVEV